MVKTFSDEAHRAATQPKWVVLRLKLCGLLRVFVVTIATILIVVGFATSNWEVFGLDTQQLVVTAPLKGVFAETQIFDVEFKWEEALKNEWTSANQAGDFDTSVQLSANTTFVTISAATTAIQRWATSVLAAVPIDATYAVGPATAKNVTLFNTTMHVGLWQLCLEIPKDLIFATAGEESSFLSDAPLRIETCVNRVDGCGYGEKVLSMYKQFEAVVVAQSSNPDAQEKQFNWINHVIENTCKQLNTLGVLTALSIVFATASVMCVTVSIMYVNRRTYWEWLEAGCHFMTALFLFIAVGIWGGVIASDDKDMQEINASNAVQHYDVSHGWSSILLIVAGLLFLVALMLQLLARRALRAAVNEFSPNVRYAELESREITEPDSEEDDDMIHAGLLDDAAGAEVAMDLPEAFIS